MAATTRTAVGDLIGYQTRDERHIGAATRIEVVTEGVLTRRLQNDPALPGVAAVIFDEVHERNLTADIGLAFTIEVAATIRPDLVIVAMSATPDIEGLQRVLDAPVVTSDGRMFDVDIRWLPRSTARAGGPNRWLRQGAATAAPARRAPTDRARCGRRGPARGRIRRRRRARVPPGHRRDPTRRTRPRRRPAEPRRRVRARRRTLARGAGPGVGAVARRASPGRVVDRHRRDVADRRRRADRDRRRPRPRAALRRAHRAQPADDGDHQPRLGRSTRRPRRPHRAGRGVPAVEQDRARHTAAPPVTRDRPGRPRRVRPRIGGVGHRGGRPRIHRRATGALARTGAGAARRPARDRPDGRLDHPARPIDARAPGPSPTGTDGGDRAVDAGLHRRLARRRARRVPWSTRRPPGRPVVARRRDRRARRPTTPPIVARCSACATVRPTSPAAPASGSTSTRSTSTAPAPRSCWPIPTGSPAAAGRASSSSVPARRRGCPTTIRSARRRSSSPPTSTAGATRSRIRLAAALDAVDVITGFGSDIVEQRSLVWDDDRGDLVERVERRLGAIQLGRTDGRADAGRRNDRRIDGSPAAVRSRAAALEGGEPSAARAGRVPPSRTRRAMARLVDADVGPDRRRVARALHAGYHRSRRPRPCRPGDGVAIAAALAGGRRPRRARPRRARAADRAFGADRLLGGRSPPRRCACRTCSASGSIRAPAAVRSCCTCSPRPTGRSR